MLTALLGIALIGQEPAAKPTQAIPVERPYIWTPKAGPEPSITSPAIFGVRPLSPLAFRVTATGKRPLKFSAENLPPGVTLDAVTGVLSGSVGFPGSFRARVTAKNSSGSDTRELRLVVGNTLCLTPPMSVLVFSANDAALLQGKLMNSGWMQGQVIGTPESILKETMDALRAARMRIGVALRQLDPPTARSLATQGVDSVHMPTSSDVKVTKEIAEALRNSGRDISLHGTALTPFETASSLREIVQSWMTSTPGDTWASIAAAGFSQDPWSPLAGPGSWNDPGNLYIGEGPLTPSEQYSHMTLWCLLAAPLMLNTDLAKLDDFALSLLTNREVLEVNQDPLGKQARLTFAAGDFEVWSKTMEDQTIAIGVFNKGETEAKATLDFGDPTVKSVEVRDLWKQEKVRMKANILPLEIRRHGAMLFRTSKVVDFRFRLGHDPKPTKKAGGGGG